MPATRACLRLLPRTRTKPSLGGGANVSPLSGVTSERIDGGSEFVSLDVSRASAIEMMPGFEACECVGERERERERERELCEIMYK